MDNQMDNVSSIEEIFSLRLVVADFYMEKPILGLDPCYSEFRGKQIKKVPIIRIFGSTLEGQKTCMHVHGVFPYFYIPYESKEFESINKAVHQIAINVDKAINISLGQGSSDAQHVFKVQLVKGIPFYGYHPKEHQYLKIYMFNPRFVRKAANLLQNGTIMNKNFHPHESHVPYILQFMIDYNLYGMSFIYVPLEIVKFRCTEDAQQIPFKSAKDVKSEQILDYNLVKKISSSTLEIDINSNFILNRFQLIHNANFKMHANPGIESIWHDEKIRRQKVVEADDEENAKEMPPLEIPTKEIRPNVQPTESELFHKTALISKLSLMETPSTLSDVTLDNTLSGASSNKTVNSEVKRKRKFNLTKLLENAIYPGECTQEDDLINASYIENHMSNTSSTLQYNKTRATGGRALTTLPDKVNASIGKAEVDESIYIKDTLVNEQLIMNLTQSQQQIPLDATLREQDVELLDVLQQLEENFDENHIDLDSTLAPLTQSHNNCIETPQLLDKKLIESVTSNMKNDLNVDALINHDLNDYDDNGSDGDRANANAGDDDDDDDDDDIVHDYSIIMDNIDDILINITQTSKSLNNKDNVELIPQIDGTDDLLETPKKSKSTRRSVTNKQNSPKTPKRKCASIIGSPLQSPRTPKSMHKYTPLPLVLTNPSIKKGIGGDLPGTLKQAKFHHNSNHEIQFDECYRRRNKIVKKHLNLDKTHITCALTRKKQEQKDNKELKVYNIEKSNEMSQKKGKSSPDSASNEDANEIISSDNQQNKSSRRTRLNGTRCVKKGSGKKNKKEDLPKSDLNMPTIRKCCVRIKKLKAMAAFQEREKQKLHNVKKEILNDNCDDDGDKVSNLKVTSESDQSINIVNGESGTYETQFEVDTHIMSFYENSFLLQSPSIFSRESSPFVIANSCPLIPSPKTSKSCEESIILLPAKTTITAAIGTGSSLSLPADGSICIMPKQLPPCRDEVLTDCHKLQIPQCRFQQPFYSNPDDVTKAKEIGHTTLYIPGNKVNDLEEFQSTLGKGLTTWRRQQLVDIGGIDLLNRFQSTQQILEYFADERSIIIQPLIEPPGRHEVKFWLKARELIEAKDEDNKKKSVLEEDSPIKVKRQKVTMMLQMDSQEEQSDSSISDHDSNVSALSFNLTLPTPDLSHKRQIKQSDTPSSSASTTEFKEQARGRASTSKNLPNQLHEKGVLSITVKESNDLNIGTQTVLAELEKSSFLRKVKENKMPTPCDQSFAFSHATFDNTYGFKVALENLQQAKSDVEFTYLTTMAMEIFVTTRRDLLPNPEFDEIRCIFYGIENSIPNDNKKLPQYTYSYIIVQSIDDIIPQEGRLHGLDRSIDIAVVQNEMEALNTLLAVCRHWDPDIYAGYEIEMSSWGYVIERAKYLGVNIAPLLSRVPTQKTRQFMDEDRDQLTELDIEMKLCGRILLDVWRLMRSEIALTSYTFENVMYHILHKRYSCHSYRVLTEWFRSPCSRWIVLEYYLERVRGTLDLLDQLDLIGRTSEMAKLIGIQFYEVLSRGSQFRVESMMLRMAKPRNFVPVSPSVQQRAHMRAPEYLPLIMEPLSRFYVDPVIVLDFQSLYPSMIIAYNYCFSTCLGRVEHLGQSTPFEFGAAHLRVSPTMLNKLIDQDLVTISPCGVVFVKSSIREGILPRMLTEILDTRQMVKQSMKLHKSNSALQRVLHSRQLGLKLMANVTYGYTAANFSGRMPAVEVGDSVVAKGRETLERAIKLVETNEEWNVKVIYGDTDSMFVLVPGRKREEAFRIGNEIAEAVTQQNPYPVKLKLEKVYQPCILQTKKRYVGYMYEAADQKEPTYEAKGIETVRRDGCPIVAKMLEKVLRILFETADVSQVKRYVCRQFTKILIGRANLQDLIFAKEFRGLNGYKPTACVPALELTRKWLQTDPRHIPRSGERVPFVIINGPPGLPLIRLVRHPNDVLEDEGLKINAIYYITKAIIPPLNRCLLLIGADVNEWFSNLPRKFFSTHTIAMNNDNILINHLGNRLKKTTISQFFSTANCLLDCGRPTQHEICQQCQQDKQRSVIILQMKLTKCERGYLTTQQICQYCCSRIGDLNCNSLDCPVLFVLETKRRDLQKLSRIRDLLQEQF